jgi:lysozyme family protein
MADFPTCFSFVLSNEAGTPPNYAVTNDNKGQVCAGINSLAFPADFAAVAALPISERPAAVYSFYQRTYWNQWIMLLVQMLAAMVMDSEVNQGQGTGVKVLQTACNTCSDGWPMIAEDGKWGPATVAAANAAGQALIPAFVQARVARYAITSGSAQDHAAWNARARKIPNFT